MVMAAAAAVLVLVARSHRGRGVGGFAARGGEANADGGGCS